MGFHPSNGTVVNCTTFRGIIRPLGQCHNKTSGTLSLPNAIPHVCCMWKQPAAKKVGGGWLTGFCRELGSHGVGFPLISRKVSKYHQICMSPHYSSFLPWFVLAVPVLHSETLSWKLQRSTQQTWKPECSCGGICLLDLSHEPSKSCLSSNVLSILLWKCFLMLLFHWNMVVKLTQRVMTNSWQWHAGKIYFKIYTKESRGGCLLGWPTLALLWL